MLDRLFLSKLSSKGKAAYWIGQIALILLWALTLFGFMGMSFDDGGEGVFIFGIIGIVLVWGFVCILVWPVGKEIEDDLDNDINMVADNNTEQVKVMKEQVRE